MEGEVVFTNCLIIIILRVRGSVRLGAGTLNLHYYDWALANNWTMPANTIMHYMSSMSYL